MSSIRLTRFTFESKFDLFNKFQLGRPFLVDIALWCPPEKLVAMFELLSSKVDVTTSLIKTNATGSTALHALCCNPHFTNSEKNLDHFKSAIKWLNEKGNKFFFHKLKFNV